MFHARARLASSAVALAVTANVVGQAPPPSGPVVPSPWCSSWTARIWCGTPAAVAVAGTVGMLVGGVAAVVALAWAAGRSWSPGWPGPPWSSSRPGSRPRLRRWVVDAVVSLVGTASRRRSARPPGRRRRAGRPGRRPRGPRPADVIDVVRVERTSAPGAAAPTVPDQTDWRHAGGVAGLTLRACASPVLVVRVDWKPVTERAHDSSGGLDSTTPAQPSSSPAPPPPRQARRLPARPPPAPVASGSRCRDADLLNVELGTMNLFQHGEVFVTEDAETTSTSATTSGSSTSTWSVGRRHDGPGLLAGDRQGAAGRVPRSQVKPSAHHRHGDRARPACGSQASDDVDVITEIGGTLLYAIGSPCSSRPPVRSVTTSVGPTCSSCTSRCCRTSARRASLKTKPTQHLLVAALRQHGDQPRRDVLRADRDVRGTSARSRWALGDVDVEGVVTAMRRAEHLRHPARAADRGSRRAAVQRPACRSAIVDWSSGRACCTKKRSPRTRSRSRRRQSTFWSAGRLPLGHRGAGAGGFHHDARVVIRWVRSDDCQTPEVVFRLRSRAWTRCSCPVRVRRARGRGQARRCWAREEPVPTLGICLGLQCMVIEYCERPRARRRVAVRVRREPRATWSSRRWPSKLAIVGGAGDLGGTMAGGVRGAARWPGRRRGVRQRDVGLERHRVPLRGQQRVPRQFEHAGFVISAAPPDIVACRVRRFRARRTCTSSRRRRTSSSMRRRVRTCYFLPSHRRKRFRAAAPTRPDDGSTGPVEDQHAPSVVRCTKSSTTQGVDLAATSSTSDSQVLREYADHPGTRSRSTTRTGYQACCRALAPQVRHEILPWEPPGGCLDVEGEDPPWPRASLAEEADLASSWCGSRGVPLAAARPTSGSSCLARDLSPVPTPTATSGSTRRRRWCPRGVPPRRGRGRGARGPAAQP